MVRAVRTRNRERMICMASPFRFRPILDGFEDRVVPSDLAGSSSSQISESRTLSARQLVSLASFADETGDTITADAIRIWARAQDGTVYDRTFLVAHPRTVAGEVELIADNMRLSGWDVEVVGGDLSIGGYTNDLGVYSPVDATSPAFAEMGNKEDAKKPANNPVGEINLKPFDDGKGNVQVSVITFRIRVVAADGTVYDKTFTVAHPRTLAAQLEIVADNMRRDGWDVRVIDGSLVVYGHKNAAGTISPIKAAGAYSPDVKDPVQPTIGGTGIDTLDLTKIPEPK
jgi:hypothetical protein